MMNRYLHNGPYLRVESPQKFRKVPLRMSKLSTAIRKNAFSDKNTTLKGRLFKYADHKQTSEVSSFPSNNNLKLPHQPKFVNRLKSLEVDIPPNPANVETTAKTRRKSIKAKYKSRSSTRSQLSRSESNKRRNLTHRKIKKKNKFIAKTIQKKHLIERQAQMEELRHKLVVDFDSIQYDKKLELFDNEE